MGTMMESAGERVHSRDIAISTYGAGENRIIIEGCLMDKRLKEYFMFTGEKRNAGVLHHMIVRMLIEGPRLIIKDIEVEMPGVPREGCGELSSSLQPLVGISITSGFTNKVKNLVGGVKGCFHLMSLVLAMAPAAVQGFWSYRATKPMDRTVIPPEELVKYFPVDSCKVWRADGPLIRKIKEEIGLS